MEALLVEPDVASHEPRKQDVARLLVERRVDGYPFLLNSDGFEPTGGGYGGHGARVVALHAADGDQSVAALGQGVCDEVFEFADFVAAVG